MTSRSITPPLSIRGPLVDGRGMGTPELMKALDGLWRAVGGSTATITQEVVTRTNEAAVSVPVAPVVNVPVAVLMPAPAEISPVMVFTFSADPQPVALSIAGGDASPVPLT